MSRFFLYFGAWCVIYGASVIAIVGIALLIAASHWSGKFGRYSSITLSILLVAAIAAGVTVVFDPLR